MLKFDKIKLGRTSLITTSPLPGTMAAIKIVAPSPSTACLCQNEQCRPCPWRIWMWAVTSLVNEESSCRLAFALPLLELLGMAWHFSKALKGNKYTSHSGHRRAADKPKSLGNEEAAGDREQGL